MKFLDAMKARYATKKYDPSKKLDPQTILELQEVLQLAPSSINSQPWRFTFVTDPELKSQLAAQSFFNEEKINDAAALVVFSACDDVAAFERWSGCRLPEPAVDYYDKMLRSSGEEAIKCWFVDQLYLALGVFLSACAAMEIDSTPMEGIKPKEYDAILKSEGYSAKVAVAVGYRAKDDHNQPEVNPKQRRELDDVVKYIV